MRTVYMMLICLASAGALPSVARCDRAATPVTSKPALSAEAPASSSSSTAVYGQFNARVHQEPGKSLPYQLLVPKAYAPESGKAWPLVVWLHGSGSKGTDNRVPIEGIAGTFLADGARTRAFVLVPQCMPGDAWHAVGINRQPEVTESTRMVIATIAELQKEFKLDDRRIYVGGFSMGGVGTWELISRYPGVFAASFAIAGGPGDRPALPSLIRHIPVWVFHGTRDNTASPENSRQIVKALNELGGRAKYTEYEGGTHESHTALAEPRLPEWILDQKREAPADFTLAKVPDGATMIQKTLPHGTHDTWTGRLQHTGHGVPRIAIDGVRYRLRPAPTADRDMTALLGKAGKGEITGICRVTGTVVLEDLAWIAVERFEIEK